MQLILRYAVRPKFVPLKGYNWTGPRALLYTTFFGVAEDFQGLRILMLEVEYDHFHSLKLRLTAKDLYQYPNFFDRQFLKE